jgi:hypothetical protein
LVVNTLEDSPRWRAPGELELVRRFLNTWDFSARKRAAEDHLPTLVADRAAWNTRLADLVPPRRGELDQLTDLRDGLRRLVEDGFKTEALNAWLLRLPPATQITVADEGPSRPRAEGWYRRPARRDRR